MKKISNKEKINLYDEATNNKIVYQGASFFKFSDDKIIDIWVLGDLNSLIKQLNQ